MWILENGKRTKNSEKNLGAAGDQKTEAHYYQVIKGRNQGIAIRK